MFTDEFKKEDFLNPPYKNSPVYFWIWNGQVTSEKPMHALKICIICGDADRTRKSYVRKSWRKV